MFLAIINDTYSEVKSLDNLQKVFVGPFIRKELSIFKICIGKYWRRIRGRQPDVERPDTAQSDENRVRGNSKDVRKSKEMLLGTIDLTLDNRCAVCLLCLYLINIKRICIAIRQHCRNQQMNQLT